MSLPGEQGSQAFDGEFLLGSRQKGERFEIAPDVPLVFLSEKNQLCNGSKLRVMCVWEGFASVTFSVPDRDTTVTINDHDTEPNATTHGDGTYTGPQWSEFIVGRYQYRVIGQRARIVRTDSAVQVYLPYRVTRELTTAGWRLSHGKQFTNGRVD